MPRPPILFSERKLSSWGHTFLVGKQRGGNVPVSNEEPLLFIFVFLAGRVSVCSVCQTHYVNGWNQNNFEETILLYCLLPNWNVSNRAMAISCLLSATSSPQVTHLQQLFLQCFKDPFIRFMIVFQLLWCINLTWKNKQTHSLWCISANFDVISLSLSLCWKSHGHFILYVLKTELMTSSNLPLFWASLS